MRQISKLLPIGLLFLFIGIHTSCSSSSDDDVSSQVKPLASIDNVSLNYRSSAEAVTLSRDVETEGAVVKLKKGVSWINNIRLSGNKILFDVEENTTTTSGHRFDTICVAVKGRL